MNYTVKSEILYWVHQKSLGQTEILFIKRLNLPSVHNNNTCWHVFDNLILKLKYFNTTIYVQRGPPMKNKAGVDG